MIFKRVFDILFVIPGVLVLSPLLLIISILIKYDTNGPVFFTQERIGLNYKPFKVFKFRTMVVNDNNLGNKITTGNDPRITKSGHWLRKYKLDELPQLFNVLKGDMSLVGPRPEVPEYIKYYPQNKRDIILSVLPGMTDIASIEFRNENELLADSSDPVKDYIEKILPIKLEYYEQYVKGRSLWMDFMIIIRTIIAIFR